MSPTIKPRIGIRVTGDLINRRHRLGARHALYHKDGTFYERLTSFPGILCDRYGYVRYEREVDFSRDPYISIGQKVNVPGGLNSHPRYKRLPSE
jgi:5-methylcytosine-specific restriction protein A